MSDSRMNRTTAAQVAEGDWPVLKLNEADIERKCGVRMGYEPDLRHEEVYLPKPKIDEILVAALEDLVLVDENGEEDLGQQEVRSRALRAYRELCDDGEETGPWVVSRGPDGPYYFAEGHEGLRWSASVEAAARFEEKGRAEGLVADLDPRADDLGFKSGSLLVVPLAACPR